MKRKKTAIIIGIILIVLGGLIIGFDQISYEQKEKVLDIGPLEATVEKGTQCVRLPIVFGVLIIVVGVCLIVIDNKQRRRK